MSEHPIREIRERWPRPLRVFFVPRIWRLYRQWGNGRLETLVMTWRAVAWR